MKLISPKYQKNIIRVVVARVTTQVILDDFEDNLIVILINESRYISIKGQIIVIFRYINKKGKVIKYFLGVVHIFNTTRLTLKSIQWSEKIDIERKLFCILLLIVLSIN